MSTSPKLRLAKDYEADLIRLLESRGLATAASGGGKSWLLRLLIEQALPHTQVLIIDPEGEFHTLREAFDLLICAPSGADAVATPDTAGILVRSLLETGVSAVFNIYDLKAHERQAFVRAFCDAMVEAPRSLWHNVLVVIDEAHIYCPEGGKTETGQAVIDLATRGRKRGFGLMLATQRLAKLHKDAAGEMLNKLIGRTSLTNDVKRAADELGESLKEMTAKLRSLQPGEWFAYGPAFPDGVQRIKVNPVVTTHPQPGKRLQEPPPAPSPTIRKLLEERLRDLPRQAKEEAATLSQLQEKLADARRVIAHLSKHECKPGITQEQVQAAVAAAVEEKDREWRRSLGMPVTEAERERYAKGIETLLEGIKRGDYFLPLVTSKGDLINGKLPDRPALPSPKAIEAAPVIKRTTIDPDKREAPPMTHPTVGDLIGSGPLPSVHRHDLPRPQVRILDTLARLAAVGVHAPSRSILAAFAETTAASSSFENNLGRLRTLGLVQYPAGGTVSITATGKILASAQGAPLTLAGLHDAWASMLPRPQAAIIRDLLDRYPQPIDRAALAAAIGTSAASSSFENNLGRLRSMGAIHYPDRGYVQASDLLFPPGLK